MEPNPMPRHRLVRLGLWLLPVLTGVLQFASFPRLNLGYLAWIAFVPLLVFLMETSRASRAFAGGVISGTIEFLLILRWVPPVLIHYGGVPPAIGWVLYVLMAIMISTYAGMAALLTKYCMSRGGLNLVYVFPFVWVSMEYLRGHFPFGGFPWLLCGYSQTEYLRLIQVADIAGVYGVSFVIAWVNVAFLLTGLRLIRRNASSWPVAVGFVLVLFCFGYGEASLRRWNSPKPEYTTVLMQGNLSADEPDSILARKVQDGYVRMANLITRIPIDLMVMPESPSPIPFQHDQNYRRVLQQLAHRYTMGLVFNNIADVEQGGTTAYFNSAYFLDREGTELARYDKIHLVPFGEYIPLRRLFFFAETITKDVEDFTPGTRYVLATLEGRPVNALICFEAVFPELARRFARDGSQLMINLTNDSWYGRSAAPFQHLAMARWRAVENRRYLLRAANSGISAVIKPTGGLQAVTGLFREEICVGLFGFLGTQTLYTRFGDAFVLLCAIITCLLVILCFRRGLTKQADGPA